MPYFIKNFAKMPRSKANIAPGRKYAIVHVLQGIKNRLFIVDNTIDAAHRVDGKSLRSDFAAISVSTIVPAVIRVWIQGLAGDARAGLLPFPRFAGSFQPAGDR